jgi:hypothetical protein
VLSTHAVQHPAERPHPHGLDAVQFIKGRGFAAQPKSRYEKVQSTQHEGELVAQEDALGRELRLQPLAHPPQRQLLGSGSLPGLRKIRNAQIEPLLFLPFLHLGADFVLVVAGLRAGKGVGQRRRRGDLVRQLLK